MKSIYKNNELLNRDELKISIDDRSFRFGDGCFETLPFFNKTPLHLNDHIFRLKETLKVLRITIDLTHLEKNVFKLIEKSNLTTGILRIIISRGEHSSGYLPNNSEAYYLIDISPIYDIPKSVDLWKSDYVHHSGISLPNIGKLNNALLYVLSKIEAKENQCDEALILNDKNQICETSSANILWVKNNQLYIPNSSLGIIPGITLHIVKSHLEFKIIEDNFLVDSLVDAEHVYVCNSIWGIIPVKSIQPMNIKYKINTYDAIIESYKNYVNQYYQGKS